MKYRLLNSVAHNFTHSFVSYMNYVDDGYVIDDLLQVARDAHGERVTIQWIPDSAPPSSLPPRVLKSIAQRKTWLPSHVANSGADIAAIREFRTDVFLKPNHQVAVEAHLVDDRGKEHIANVIF
jgi:hypothetical protein